MDSFVVGPYETWNVEGNIILIKANPEKGFNFGYTIYIPNTINSETTLIVEGTNIGQTKKKLNNEEQLDYILKGAIDPGINGYPIYEIATNLGMPILFPIFPKWGNDEEPIYNHMLSSNSLDHNTPMLKELGLERVDLQLIRMIEDAKQVLVSSGIKVDERIIIDGFSASAKFANRFTLLHPEIVKMCIAGGVTGALTLPLEKVNDEVLLWPVGVGNLEELLGEEFNVNIEEFKKVKQFYYMGMKDTKNPYSIAKETNPNDFIPENPGIIKTDELRQMYNYLGKNQTGDRWKKTIELYNELGIDATFKSYDGVEHTPKPATADITNFIQNNVNLSKTK